jgi:UDP-2,3-diacylglucosamine pyrophosphatase LpxH
MTATPSGQPLWSWLHVSDIHVGHGGATWRHDQDIVLRSLIEDLPRLLAAGAPRPQAVLVTGDIGATGAVRNSDEYQRAVDWLIRIKEASGAGHVYAVPGNHDVQRTPEVRGPAWRLVRDLRDGTDAVDDAYENRDDAATLHTRLGNYMRFCADMDSPHAVAAGGAWSAAVPTGADVAVRLLGLNTALLCNNDDDERKLRMGRAPLNQLLSGLDPEREIVIALMHHPVDWLAHDEEAYLTVWLRKNTDICLRGHIHEAAAQLVVTGAGQQFVTITAGAVHADQDHASAQTPHSYSLGAVWRNDDTSLSVCIWPRRWSAKRAEFIVDAESLPEGGDWVRLPLRHRPAPPNHTARSETDTRPGQALRALSQRLVQRLGQRRTAFPTDMSIRELAERDLIVATELSPHERTRGESTTIEELAEEAGRGGHTLILGGPGAGKTVIAYQVGLAVDAAGAAAPLTVDLSALPPGTTVDHAALFGSMAEAAGLQVVPAVGPALILVLDGVDEALAAGLSAAEAARTVVALSKLGTLVATCRVSDYVRQLAAAIPQDLFSAIRFVKDWRVEEEFADFLARLAAQGLLPDAALLDEVRRSEVLARLIARPLYARMLTYVADRDGRTLPADLTDLYSSYLGKLASTTDTSLRRAHCADDPQAGRLWRETSWHVFSRRPLGTETLPPEQLVRFLQESDLSADCAYRVLAGIMDIPAGQPTATFIHYSFFEFLLAQYLTEQLTTSYPDAPRNAVALLNRDLPQEIRRHLVRLLRKTVMDLYAWPQWLARVYRAATDDDQRGRRTACNLIAYLACRLDVPAVEALASLLADEADPFLRNSLMWALTRCDDNNALRTYVAELSSDSILASLNRGYLLYYFGDISGDEPPYADDPPHVSWATTRARLAAKYAADDYARVPAARQAVDLYTFYDLAAIRGQRLTPDEESAVERIETMLVERGVPRDLVEILRSAHQRVRP